MDSTNSTSGSGVGVQYLGVKLVKELGGTYASALGINLDSVKSDEIFKWLLASQLLGARVSEQIAMKTYKEFETAGVLSVETISGIGWPCMVRILSQGGYVRYELASRILEVTIALREKYDADLNRLHFFARDGRDLEKKLIDLGKGITPAIARLFLRELKGLWDKADPPLSKPTLLAAEKLGLIQTTDEAAKLNRILKSLEASENTERTLDIEAALLRLGNNYCRKNKCFVCPMREVCQNPSE